jgi:hypothetical protein
MSRDHNDIYSIVERLRLIEADLSPTSTKKGLTAQQKSVPQLPALFKPKTQKILGGNPNAKNPMSGYMVGSDESVERKEAMLEADVAEDVLEKVKSSFKDFIKNVEEEIKDSDIKEKKKEDTDLKNKDKKDRDLIVKVAPVAEDPTQQEIPEPTMTATPTINPTYGESAPVKSVALNDGMICEIHGNERDGFEIRRGTRSLPTRFKNITQAEMALEMFMARMKRQDESQDYLDEE